MPHGIIASWVAALATQVVYFGFIATIIPTRWLLSVIEFVEFIAWIVGGGNWTLLLQSLNSPEVGGIVSGGFIIAAVAMPFIHIALRVIVDSTTQDEQPETQ